MLHELGVIHFKSSDYKQAEKYFLGALQACRTEGCGAQVCANTWEPTLSNLARTYQRLR